MYVMMSFCRHFNMLLLFTVWGISLASKLTWTAAGADPEIEKEGREYV